jgi:uncharacterized protein YkwD
MRTFKNTPTHAQSARGNPGWYAPALLALLFGLVSVGCAPEQLELQHFVNGEREHLGLPALLPSPHAMAKAQAWAEEMASSGNLRHSDLAAGMPAGFRKIGENVGRGPDIESIHQAFMLSDGHRANVVDPEYNWIGTGYARSNTGVVYVAVVFARY